MKIGKNQKSTIKLLTTGGKPSHLTCYRSDRHGNVVTSWIEDSGKYGVYPICYACATQDVANGTAEWAREIRRR